MTKKCWYMVEYHLEGTPNGQNWKLKILDLKYIFLTL